MLYVTILTESLAWENFILETYYPVQYFKYFCWITMQTVMLSQMKQETIMDIGRRTFKNWYRPKKHFCEHIYVSKGVQWIAEKNFSQKSKKLVFSPLNRENCKCFLFFHEARSQSSLVPQLQQGSGAGLALPFWGHNHRHSQNPGVGNSVGPQLSPPETEEEM